VPLLLRSRLEQPWASARGCFAGHLDGALGRKPFGWTPVAAWAQIVPSWTELP
jgi:hypothetical protein